VPVRFQLMPKKVRQPEFIERKMMVPEPRPMLPPFESEQPKPEAPAPKVAAPDKLVQPEKPKSTFGQKLETVVQKPREWDESRWID